MIKTLLKASWVLLTFWTISAFGQEVFINEIHYDNSGIDTGEAIELAGPAGTDLSGWSLVVYNGANGTVYHTNNLIGAFPDLGNGMGVLSFDYPSNGIQNGPSDGIALVHSGSVIQFLSYEGTFQAVNGPALGLMSENIGVMEDGNTPIGYSLQLSGTGSKYADFTWNSPATATFGAVNNGQLFQSDPVLFVNEFHYDNAGADTQEGIEVAGTAGLDLGGYSLELYNGNGGVSYRNVPLTGVIPNQDNGYGTLYFPISGLQNGPADGFALLSPGNEVIQFLSYEGTFEATNGPAIGMTSEDIGVLEPSDTPLGFSLQLQGTGTRYTDFTWTPSPISGTYNSINTNQSFGGIIVNPEPVLISIAEARSQAQGSRVLIQGVITASDQFGGPSFMQDLTGGIPVFDSQIHGEGVFQIGDEIKILGSIGAFNEQIQLVDVEEFELISSGNSLSPLLVSIDQINPNLEGQLIQIPNASFVPAKGIFFPESNYVISDGNGSLDFRVDGQVSSLIGRVIPSSAQAITGVLGSFRGTLQLLPRFVEDVPGTTAYTQEGSDIPTEETLDIMTWNMEFFGATLNNYGPSDVALQAENALKVFQATMPDIIAVQEVSDEVLLQTVVSQMPGYAVLCSDRYSYSFDGPDPTFPPQKLCFIYNTAIVSLQEDRVMFEEAYDEARLGLSSLLDSYPTGSPSSFWSSGRLPWMVTVIADINGVKERINFINIHAKSGAQAADQTRRIFDNQVLKDSLDANYDLANIVLLGDYNDDLDESIGSGPSTYSSILSDEDYDGITISLSEAGLRSYLFQDNVIDHITISNELYDNYLTGSEGLFIPFGLLDNYSNTTSDHLPVRARFIAGEPVLSDAGEGKSVYLGYPPLASTTLSAMDATGGTAPYTYSWSDGQTGQEITVAPTETTTYTLTVTDAVGNQFTDEVSVCVIDVRSGNKGDKVWVCMPTGKAGHFNTLSVSPNAVESFLARGASLGICGTVPCGEIEEASLERGFQSAAIINAYPNPMEDQVSIQLDQSIDLNISFVLFSETGEVIESGTGQFQQGKIEFLFRSNRFNNGLYYLHINGEGETKVTRLWKK